MATTTKERLAHLNALREKAGLKPVMTWKESKAKLEVAIEKLETAAEAPVEKATKGEDRKKPEAKADVFSLGDVARELGKNPKVLRAKFRRLYPNHDGAWEFPNSRRSEIVEAAKGSKA